MVKFWIEISTTTMLRLMITHKKIILAEIQATMNLIMLKAPKNHI